MNKNIAIVGAGILGLTLAYKLSQKGFTVTLFEADDRIGGMSAPFDFDGLTIERYYHFFCKPDFPLFELLKELEIYRHLKWEKTKMGFFYKGKVHNWGNPIALLGFPHLSIISKIRFGFQVIQSVKRNRWDKLENLTAVQWTRKAVGDKAYRILWESLLDLKFHQFKDQLAASWLWRRLRRVGRSRKNLLSESLAYLEGGVEILLNALKEKITLAGGKILTNSPVSQINIHPKTKQVKSLTLKEKEIPFDQIISTIPLPFIPALIPDLPQTLMEKYKSIGNIGVICVIFKLTQSLTGNFWLNITDQSIELPGLIEFSNLSPLPEKIIYFPFYLHHTDENYAQSDQFFINLVIGYCKKINPEFTESWLLGKRVHRYEYAQPVCKPGFLSHLPPIQTEIKGLSIVDTSYYYPEDRSISESVEIAGDIATQIASIN